MRVDSDAGPLDGADGKAFLRIDFDEAAQKHLDALKADLGETK